MQVNSWSLGQLETNCYLVTDTESMQAVVIDPADEGGFISQEVLAAGVELRAIVLTHGHFDHILGLLELKLNFPQVPIMMHQQDLFLLESVQSRAQHWLHLTVDPAPPPDIFVDTNDVVEVGQQKLTIISTPGHTPGSITLYNDQLIFSGDTVFAQGVGRADFSYSRPLQLAGSVKQVRQLARDSGAVCYAGHGPSWRE